MCLILKGNKIGTHTIVFIINIYRMMINKCTHMLLFSFNCKRYIDPKLILHNNKTKLEYIGYIQFKENYNCTWQGLAERGSLACHSNRAALLA